MQVWIIYVSEDSVDRVVMMTSETQALQFIGRVVIGDHPLTTIKSVYVVDVVAGTMTAIETCLDGMSLGFRNKTV
jgi:hypothetical protein